MIGKISKEERERKDIERRYTECKERCSGNSLSSCRKVNQKGRKSSVCEILWIKDLFGTFVSKVFCCLFLFYIREYKSKSSVFAWVLKPGLQAYAPLFLGNTSQRTKSKGQDVEAGKEKEQELRWSLINVTDAWSLIGIPNPINHVRTISHGEKGERII